VRAPGRSVYPTPKPRYVSYVRVRLNLRDGSHESAELSQEEAEALISRINSAALGINERMTDAVTRMVEVGGDTHGLPGIFYKEHFIRAELVP
jgi:hypothetical protein